jgi:hypothetical protein
LLQALEEQDYLEINPQLLDSLQPLVVKEAYFLQLDKPKRLVEDCLEAVPQQVDLRQLYSEEQEQLLKVLRLET